MRNLKKVIALVAVFAMMVTSVAFAQSYSDVKEDDNYYEAIEMLSKLNILTGDDEDGDGVMSFRPDDTITRAEVAAVVCRIQNLNNLSQTGTSFTDVPSSHWASGYVAQAAGQGIINGYGDGNFGPEDEVTYEQAVKMFVETLGYSPMVEVNGGYPSGHLTVATRYGIVDGVVGASVGAKATRGQIAQIAFNAVDTPVMDRSSYGKDEEFAPFDGTNGRSFITLLTRDLKVKKFSGLIDSNQINNTIDTDKKAEIGVDTTVGNATENANYKVNEINKYYEADSNAGELIGYYVEGYAQETSRSGEYDVLAVAATSNNKTVKFTLDQYADATNAQIEYYKNDNDSKTTIVKVDTDADVYYNGVLVNDTLTNVLASAKVTSDCIYSGNITLIDNDATNGYDVVKVEVASSAVVKEVKTSGKVTFKNAPKNSFGDKIELDFDEDATDTIIKLTKDGKAIENTDLVEWDVLSVLRPAGSVNYYDVKVLSSSKIDGAISSRASSKTSADGYKYTIDGKVYDVAANCYGANIAASGASKGWTVGAAGAFYVDENGKIVAYDKNGSATLSSTAGNYGYILNASNDPGSFGGKTLTVRVLSKDGKVYDFDFASKVRIENPTTVGIAAADLSKNADTLEDSANYNIQDLNTTNIKAAIVNNLVTYELNSSNEIKSITFATNDDEDSFYVSGKGDTVTYDEEDFSLSGTDKGSFDIDEDTVIFYINAESGNISKIGSAGLTAGMTLSKTASKVGKASSLADGSYNAVVFDEDNGVAGAVVFFNTSGGFSPSSNLAVIDSVSEAADSTYLVKFYLNGELLEATTDEDLASDAFSKNTARGSMYKLSLSADGTVITDAKRYTEFATNTTDIKNGIIDGLNKTNDTSKHDKFVTNQLSANENVYVGPAYDFTTASNRVEIATVNAKADAWDFTSSQRIKASDANVYVVDMNKKNNKLTVGDISDIDVEDDYTERALDPSKTVVNVDGKKAVGDGVQAYGLFDFVVAVEYDGDVLDVVVYKAYDFGKINIVNK